MQYCCISISSESTDVEFERKSSKTSNEHSLIDALSLQDEECIDGQNDETKSLKSLGSYGGVTGVNWRDGGLPEENKSGDGDLENSVVHGDGNGSFPGGDTFFGVTDDYNNVSDGGTINGVDCGDGPVISITSDAELHETTIPTIALAPEAELQVPHMTLSSLQEEVRLVATEVLSRPKSGRVLAEDAKMATFLFLERMQGLLDPTLEGEFLCFIAFYFNVDGIVTWYAVLKLLYFICSILQRINKYFNQ